MGSWYGESHQVDDTNPIYQAGQHNFVSIKTICFEFTAVEAEFKDLRMKDCRSVTYVQPTEHQIRALEKGLPFCPTPGATDKSQIWEYFKEFHRRLELVQFFKPQENHLAVNIS